jgi:hypothetical protein
MVMYFSSLAFVLQHLLQGVIFMDFEKICKFYQDSKCILEGGYCDLDCNRLMSDEDFRFYDKMDALTQWRIEEVEKEIRVLRPRK